MHTSLETAPAPMSNSDGCGDIDDQAISSQQRSETSKRKHTSVTEEDADDGDDVNGESSRTGAKKTRKSLGNPTKVDDEMDEGVQVIDNEPTREEKRCDIAYHFREPVLRLVNGKMKKCCGCKLCPGKKFIVNEVTTLRRHLEAYHSGKYRKWAKAAGFQSKLPGDVKKRKAAAELQTRTLDRHLGEEKKTAEPVERYTDKDFDKDFLQAAIEWLVVTGQPPSAFEHPKFKEMIDLAARSTNGVKIPTVLELHQAGF